jgi:hypothetical protein
MIRTTAMVSSIFLTCTVCAAHAQVPAKKGQSTEHKAAAPRSNADIKKGAATAKKDPKNGTSIARRTGTDIQGTEAQGIAR